MCLMTPALLASRSALRDRSDGCLWITRNRNPHCLKSNSARMRRRARQGRNRHRLLDLVHVGRIFRQQQARRGRVGTFFVPTHCGVVHVRPRGQNKRRFAHPTRALSRIKFFPDLLAIHPLDKARRIFLQQQARRDQFLCGVCDFIYVSLMRTVAFFQRWARIAFGRARVA